MHAIWQYKFKIFLCKHFSGSCYNSIIFIEFYLARVAQGVNTRLYKHAFRLCWFNRRFEKSSPAPQRRVLHFNRASFLSKKRTMHLSIVFKILYPDNCKSKYWYGAADRTNRCFVELMTLSAFNTMFLYV